MPGRAEEDDSVFCRMVEIMLPAGGWVLALVEAYFDESIGSKGPPTLCVAGYLMQARQAKRLEREWRQTLREDDLPFFRMSACAGGGHPFDEICLKRRDIIARRMYSHIKRRTILGFAVAVNLKDYADFAPQHPQLGSAYTFCVHVLIGGVQHWAMKSDYQGKIAYYFEAGHASQSEAGRIMEEVFHNPTLKNAARYAGHGFVEKACTPAVQAADILAWHYYTDIRHKAEGRARRKDFAALLEHPHSGVFVTPEMVVTLGMTWGKDPTPAESLEYLYFGDARPESAARNELLQHALKRLS